MILLIFLSEEFCCRVDDDDAAEINMRGKKSSMSSAEILPLIFTTHLRRECFNLLDLISITNHKICIDWVCIPVNVSPFRQHCNREGKKELVLSSQCHHT